MPDYLGDTFKMIVGNDFGYLTLCLLAPLVEELVFRGAVLRSLLGSLGNRWAAITLSAVIFAAVHLNPVQMPHAFLVGLLLGWMYSRTGSILPGVAVHWVNNTVAYALYLLFPYSADMQAGRLLRRQHRARANGRGLLAAHPLAGNLSAQHAHEAGRTMTDAATA